MRTFCFALAATLAMTALARADESRCVPLATEQAQFAKYGGSPFKLITRDQLLFARGLFSMSPPTSLYPPGDEAMISVMPNGSAAVIFLNGDKVCGRMAVDPPMTEQLLNIDKSI